MIDFACEKRLVSVVILNWNGMDFLDACIESIAKQSYSSLELLLVDNGSIDGSVEMVRQKYPSIRIIENGSNLGFAQGMNVGIGESRGEYLLLLNEDAYLHSEFVAEGVREFEADARIGWVGGVVREMSATGRSEGIINSACSLRARFQLREKGDATVRQRSLIASPCAMLLRKEAVDDAAFEPGNWLDRSYFAYWEDTDLGLRLLLRGWTCIYTPKMCVWHFVSGSVSGKRRLIDKPMVFRRMALRNRHSTIIKNLPASILLRMLPWLILVELLVVGYYAVFSFSTLICNFQALGDTFSNLRRLLGERALIQGKARISPEEFKRLVSGAI